MSDSKKLYDALQTMKDYLRSVCCNDCNLTMLCDKMSEAEYSLCEFFEEVELRGGSSYEKKHC